jgi:hypothetical protein
MGFLIKKNFELPYKVYSALLTQTGATDPTAIVLENTLGTITFDYFTAGYYNILSSNLFVLDKTFIFINLARFDSPTSQPTICMASYFDLSTINLYSYYYDFALTRFFPADDLIINGSLEIRVYN